MKEVHCPVSPARALNQHFEVKKEKRTNMKTKTIPERCGISRDMRTMTKKRRNNLSQTAIIKNHLSTSDSFYLKDNKERQLNKKLLTYQHNVNIV